VWSSGHHEAARHQDAAQPGEGPWILAWSSESPVCDLTVILLSWLSFCSEACRVDTFQDTEKESPVYLGSFNAAVC